MFPEVGLERVEAQAEGDWVGQMDNQVSQCALLCELRRRRLLESSPGPR